MDNTINGNEMEKIKLESIKIKTADGKVVELSMTEARELFEQLNALFGAKFTQLMPVVIERTRSPWPLELPQIWCGNNTDCTDNNSPKLLGNSQCCVSSPSGMTVSYGGTLEF